MVCQMWFYYSNILAICFKFLVHVLFNFLYNISTWLNRLLLLHHTFTRLLISYYFNQVQYIPKLMLLQHTDFYCIKKTPFPSLSFRFMLNIWFMKLYLCMLIFILILQPQPLISRSPFPSHEYLTLTVQQICVLQ